MDGKEAWSFLLRNYSGCGAPLGKKSWKGLSVQTFFTTLVLVKNKMNSLGSKSFGRLGRP
jgi:hypothetical protein